ncbi:MAG TPA: TOBE domain-containing protein, partial [Thermoleophilaceae bacterium]|nr:TOBE domain-containing protein [Thermoleophilaceae bacterium]
FVADFTGAVVLTGTATAGEGELTRVDLDGGGAVASVDHGRGRVAVSVHPWEIAIERGSPEEGSALNRLAVAVTTVTAVGNRTRVGLATPQALAAEVTTASSDRLALAPGERVVAVWKAAATRLSPL